MVFVDGLPTAGILLIRLPNAMHPLDQADKVANIIAAYGSNLLGAFTVLDTDYGGTKSQDSLWAKIRGN